MADKGERDMMSVDGEIDKTERMADTEAVGSGRDTHVHVHVEL